MSEIRGYAVQSPTSTLDVTKLKTNLASEPNFPKSRQIIAALRQAWPERMIPHFRRRLSWHAS